MAELNDHPLDRPIWTALTTRQAEQAVSNGQVRRYHSAISPFAASADVQSKACPIWPR